MTIAGEALTSLANLAASVLLARALGADGKGVFTFVMTVTATAASVLGLRWDRPAGHFLARDVTALPTILTSIALVTAIAAGITGVGLAACPEHLVMIVLRGVDPSSAAVLTWLVGAQCLYLGTAALFAGLRKFTYRSRFLLSFHFLQAAVTGALFVFGVDDVSLYLKWYAITGWGVGLAWLLVFAFVQRVSPRWDWRLIKRMATFGSVSYFSLLLDLVTVRLDVILLNFLASASAVGVYSVAVAIGARLATIPQIVAYVVYHRTSARELGPGATTAQILRVATVVVVCGGLLAVAAGTVLVVPVFGPDFAKAVPALWVMIPAMSIWGLFKLLASDIEGRGRPGIVALISLAANATIVILDVGWIPRYGIVGAAWASLIAYGVALGLAAVAFCKVTGLQFREAYLLRGADISSIYRLAGRVIRTRQLMEQPG